MSMRTEDLVCAYINTQQHFTAWVLDGKIRVSWWAKGFVAVLIDGFKVTVVGTATQESVADLHHPDSLPEIMDKIREVIDFDCRNVKTRIAEAMRRR